MTRYCDECERFQATAFGWGYCPKLEEIASKESGVNCRVSMDGNADAGKCPYFKEMGIDDNE